MLFYPRSNIDHADCFAVTQHRRAVAKRRNLDEAVRNEDDGAASLALTLDHVEHTLGKVGRQRRRHFVKQKHIGLDRQCTGEIEYAQHGERNVPGGVADI